MRFFSDNTATACPEILAAISEVNVDRAKAYGDDEWTRRIDQALGAYFGTEVRAFVVVTGTAANSLSLATLTPPYGTVFAHEGAHILNDECGAPEFYSGGGRIVGVPGPNGKLTAETLGRVLDALHVSVHSMQPAAISLTQATELGTSYRPDEIAALSALAHRHRLHVHMDGARFANSVEFLGCAPADLSWRAGVDVLSFGATKNGALAAEAVVFFNRDLVRDFELRRKRAGHLISKSRYVSAQLLAYIGNEVWRRNAARANGLARQIGAAAGSALLYPVEANELFLALGAEGKQRLRAAGFEFHASGGEASGNTRFVVSWDQPESDVAALCKALRERQW
ncbi:MAG: beta-eliminating lyase-related protein [Gammaproteobacteria bacterium]